MLHAEYRCTVLRMFICAHALVPVYVSFAHIIVYSTPYLKQTGSIILRSPFWKYVMLGSWMQESTHVLPAMEIEQSKPTINYTFRACPG